MRLALRNTCVLLTLAFSATAHAAAVTPTTPAPSAPAPALSAPALSAPVSAPTTRTLTLAPGALVAVSPMNELSSKTLKLGDKFKFATMSDVSDHGVVLIPQGTTGEGTVTYVKGTGVFGRSGKLEVSFNSLDLGGRTIALTGKYRQEGSANSGAAVGATLAVGLIGGLVVSGHSAVIKHGQALQAQTNAEESFTIPAEATASAAAAPAAAPTPAPAH